MVVIGHGMIAKTFLKYDFGKVCIFASGVSKSNNSNESDYDKEVELLKKTSSLYPDHKLIYFSTLSILSNNTTKYIQHKLHIENLISNICDNFLILRLPIVVGNTNNRSQLIPFLYEKLMNDETINIKKNTLRDLIDVEDVPKIVEFLLQTGTVKLYNISLNNKIFVHDIVNLLALYNNINYFNKKIVPGDNFYSFDEKLINFIPDQLTLNCNSEIIIEKYYKL